MKIVGIIPAAGKGTRLGLPYPKPLVPVSFEGQRVITVIESNLIQLFNAGITDAVVVIAYEHQVIKQYLGEIRCGVHIRYVYQNRMRSKEGLTDAVMCAKHVVGDAVCVMLMADVYFTDPETTKQLVAEFREVPKAIAGVAIWKTFEPHRFGVIEGDEQGNVQHVVDKPEGWEVAFHWGAVIFRPEFWFYMDYELNNFSGALNAAVKDRVIYTLAEGKYLDLGTPISLIRGIMEVNKDK